MVDRLTANEQEKALENCRLAHGIELRNAMIIAEKRFMKQAALRIAEVKRNNYEAEQAAEAEHLRLKNIIFERD